MAWCSNTFGKCEGKCDGNSTWPFVVEFFFQDCQLEHWRNWHERWRVSSSLQGSKCNENTRIHSCKVIKRRLFFATSSFMWYGPLTVEVHWSKAKEDQQERINCCWYVVHAYYLFVVVNARKTQWHLKKHEITIGSVYKGWVIGSRSFGLMKEVMWLTHNYASKIIKLGGERKEVILKSCNHSQIVQFLWCWKDNVKKKTWWKRWSKTSTTCMLKEGSTNYPK